MFRNMIRNCKNLAAVVAILGAALMAAPAVAHDAEAEAQRIRDLGAKWVAAIAANDVASIVAIYTVDGQFLAPGAPPALGHASIGEAWKGLLALPGMSLTFAPTRIDVSKRADMALDIGTYSLAFDGDKGRVRDEGKYVVVWMKVDGEWKAAADIFNTNLAAQ